MTYKLFIDDERLPTNPYESVFLRTSADAIEYIKVYVESKVLNAWHEHFNSPWLSDESRKESIYKLKKGK